MQENCDIIRDNVNVDGRTEKKRETMSKLKNGIPANSIKIIAACLMLIDHIAAFLIYPKLANGGFEDYYFWNDLYWSMRIVGRVAFPLFAFFVVEGKKYTKNPWKYIARLLGFAVISEIPFVLARKGHMRVVSGEFPYVSMTNVFFTMAIALFAMILMDWLVKRISTMIFVLPVIYITVFVADIVDCDYGLYGVLAMEVGYLVGKITDYMISLGKMKEKEGQMAVIIAICTILFFMNGIEKYVVFAIIPVLLYNGERGRGSKYFFYAFYPIHIMVLYAVKCLILQN